MEIQLDLKIQTEKKENHKKDLEKMTNYIEKINKILEKIDEDPINKYDINIDLSPSPIKISGSILSQTHLSRRASNEPKKAIDHKYVEQFLSEVSQDEYIQKTIIKDQQKIRFERDLGYDRYARYGITGTLTNDKITKIKISVIQQYDDEEN